MMLCNQLPPSLILCQLALGGPVAGEGSLVEPAPRVSFHDLNGDDLPDRLTSGPDGALRVALNRGHRVFERVRQALPSVEVSAVLAEDLDHDGHVDLYLVSPGANVALMGDGTGAFREATSWLGLEDDGVGVDAELLDMDGDGAADVLLHNEGGDVVFWWSPAGVFERDPATPPTPGPEHLARGALAQSLELLAGESDERVATELDPTVRPIVTHRRREGGGVAERSTPGGGERPRAEDDPGGVGSSSLQGGGPTLSSSAVPQLLPTGLTSEEKEILGHLSIVFLDDGSGNLVNKTIRVSGVNWQVVNGLAATNGFPADPDSTDPGLTSVNGVGNLIVGYNELGNPNGDNRKGSHNVVVGHGNSYASFGGWVGPQDNTISAPFASVIGGSRNTANGVLASVSGGASNTASGDYASISGGRLNKASGDYASVSGGVANLASGYYASVSGGLLNVASGGFAAVSGGSVNTASGNGTSVSGGNSNTALYEDSSVSGGRDNTALGFYASVSGGKNNIAFGNYASISGGRDNFVDGHFGSISGGRSNRANGTYASVSGGKSRFVGGAYNWAAGGLFQNY